MAKVSNTPLQTLSFDLERRKSFTFQVRVKQENGTLIDLTGCTMRFVMKPADVAEDPFDLTNLLVNSEGVIGEPLLGLATFSFQAAELDAEPGEYAYSLVLWTPDGFSTVLAKGTVNLIENGEALSMRQLYSTRTPNSALELTMRSGSVVQVSPAPVMLMPPPGIWVRSINGLTPDANGDVTYRGAAAWGDITDKPSEYPPSSHPHPISDVTGLQGALDAKAASSHGHTIANVSGLQGALDGKQPAGSYAASTHTHTAANITDFTEATQDIVGGMVAGAGGTYNDTAGTITLPSGGGGGGAVDSVAGRTGDVVLSSADLTDVASLTTDAELTAGLAGKANTSHTHPASQISDSTATGRSVLTATDAAAARTAIGAGTSSLTIGTTGTTAAAGNRQATATAIGMVELATTAEATTGTDTVRAVTPAGLKAVADTKAPALGADDNYVTDAEKVKLTNLSGTNTGDEPNASATVAGIVELATTTEATTGTDTQRAVTPEGLKAGIDAASGKYVAINAQAVTAYTLAASDAGKLVTLTNAAAITLTVPASTFTAGQRVDIGQRGAGVVTVVAGSGMTVNPPSGGSLVMQGQYAYASLVFISPTEADLVGLVAAP